MQFHIYEIQFYSTISLLSISTISKIIEFVVIYNFNSSIRFIMTHKDNIREALTNQYYNKKGIKDIHTVNCIKNLLLFHFVQKISPLSKK